MTPSAQLKSSAISLTRDANLIGRLCKIRKPAAATGGGRAGQGRMFVNGSFGEVWEARVQGSIRGSKDRAQYTGNNIPHFCNAVHCMHQSFRTQRPPAHGIHVGGVAGVHDVNGSACRAGSGSER